MKYAAVIPVLLFGGCASIFIQPRDGFDIFTKGVKTILNDSGATKCFINYVSDSSYLASDFDEAISSSGMLNSELGIGVFRAPKDAFKSSTPARNLSHLFNQLRYHFQVSPRCRTFLLVGNDKSFFKSLIQWSFKNNFLIWSTRLLVVTELRPPEFQNLKTIFSKTNSILLVLENGIKLYLHLPYSHRLMQVASWRHYTGLLYVSDYGLFPNKFHKLRDGANLTVVAEDFPPHVRVTEFPHVGGGEPPHIHTGPLVKFLQLLSTDINFNYTLVRPPDRAWGYLPPNGSWIGMVGMVVRHEVDFALGPFGITYDRAMAVDYTWPLVGDAVRITAKRGETEMDPWAFLMPLTPVVWAGMFLCLSLSVALHLVLSVPEMHTSTPTKGNWEKYVRVFLMQDVGNALKYATWERWLLGSWILTVLVLMESYCGNLMSLLAVRYVPQPYQSLRAVLDDPKVTMVWEGGTAYVGYFMSARSGVFKEVAESRNQGRIAYIKATEYTNVLGTSVMDGDHVLVIEDLALKMLFGEEFTKTGVCNYYLSDETFIHFIYGLVAQKYSPLADSISQRVIAITHSGIYSQWMRTAVPNTSVCLHAPKKVAVKSALSLRNVWGVFVILGSGYITSLLVWAFEIASDRLLHLSDSVLEL